MTSPLNRRVRRLERGRAEDAPPDDHLPSDLAARAEHILRRRPPNPRPFADHPDLYARLLAMHHRLNGVTA